MFRHVPHVPQKLQFMLRRHRKYFVLCIRDEITAAERDNCVLICLFVTFSAKSNDSVTTDLNLTPKYSITCQLWQRQHRPFLPAWWINRLKERLTNHKLYINAIAIYVCWHTDDFSFACCIMFSSKFSFDSLPRGCCIWQGRGCCRPVQAHL